MGYRMLSSIWWLGLCCCAVGGCAGSIDSPPHAPPSDSKAATVEVPALASETAQSRSQEDADAQLPPRQEGKRTANPNAQCPELDGPDGQCRSYDERLKDLERRIEELKNKVLRSHHRGPHRMP